jgi:hypothetical protein
MSQRSSGGGDGDERDVGDLVHVAGRLFQVSGGTGYSQIVTFATRGEAAVFARQREMMMNDYGVYGVRYEVRELLDAPRPS